MVLKLYIDPLSQPSRALMLFVRINKIEVEEITLSMQKGEHKTEEYKQVSKYQTVPCIVHDGFHLGESVAILKYLARVFPVDDHWYPKNDPKAIARIDEYIAWQHIGLRVPILRYLIALFKPEKLELATLPTDADIAVFKNQMIEALDQVENIWLESSPFVSGDQITIADLLAVSEIEMTQLFEYDSTDGRPKLTAYLARVKEALRSHFDEVHENLYQARELAKARLAK